MGEPAWDILLNLYEAHLSQVRTMVTGACLGSRVPATSALRWLKVLEVRGLVERQGDPLDGRRVFVSLSPKGVAEMTSLFEAFARAMLELQPAW